MRGAAPLVLDDDCVWCGECGDALHAGADDDDDPIENGGGIGNQVRQHRAAAKRMEDLGQRGSHPRPEAGREDDGSGTHCRWR